ncbi:MAG: hypothetical protein KGL39_27255 [Patescibacteria group bacterium]|nr:hypothetical protein [Patescibacteria group bacterium]
MKPFLLAVLLAASMAAPVAAQNPNAAGQVDQAVTQCQVALQRYQDTEGFNADVAHQGQAMCHTAGDMVKQYDPNNLVKQLAMYTAATALAYSAVESYDIPGACAEMQNGWVGVASKIVNDDNYADSQADAIAASGLDWFGKNCMTRS